jgi:1,4-alpha-glucan branching enzyme
MLAYMRRGSDPHELAVIVANFTPVPRQLYRIGVPQSGLYRERFNSDAVEYGGSGLGNAGMVEAEAHPAHGHAHSLVLTLPPLATVIFTREPGSG